MDIRVGVRCFLAEKEWSGFKSSRSKEMIKFGTIVLHGTRSNLMAVSFQSLRQVLCVLYGSCGISDRISYMAPSIFPLFRKFLTFRFLASKTMNQ